MVEYWLVPLRMDAFAKEQLRKSRLVVWDMLSEFFISKGFRLYAWESIFDKYEVHQKRNHFKCPCLFCSKVKKAIESEYIMLCIEKNNQ